MFGALFVSVSAESTLALQKIRLFGELMRLSKPPGNATARRERLG